MLLKQKKGRTLARTSGQTRCVRKAGKILVMFAGGWSVAAAARTVSPVVEDPSFLTIGTGNASIRILTAPPLVGRPFIAGRSPGGPTVTIR
jgi:hypothetical protein